MNPVHNFPPYFSKIRSNIILPSVPSSTEMSFSLRFSDQHFVCISHLSHVCYIPMPSRPLITLIIFDEVYKVGSKQPSPVPAISSFLGPNILLSTLCPNIFSLCYPFNVRNSVSHPYKTTGKFVVPYILTFRFLDRSREGNG